MIKIRREGIIVIVIVILILIINTIIKIYTRNEIDEIKNILEEIKELGDKDIDKEKLVGEVKRLEDKWKNSKEKLSIIIEHQELEKIDNYIQDIKYMEIYQMKNKINIKIEKTINLLDEIDSKYEINIGNIF